MGVIQAKPLNVKFQHVLNEFLFFNVLIRNVIRHYRRLLIAAANAVLLKGNRDDIVVHEPRGMRK